MYTLVLLRHGESKWNKENRFTGWTDVDLSEHGLSEAKTAGKLLKENNLSFDLAFVSVLKRAVRTLWIVLDELDLMWLPVRNSWRLNERNYGSLQGLNKSETAKKYGDDQVLIWRRSYDIPPPAYTEEDERYPGNDRRYSNLSKEEIPLCESLKNTVERFMPFWENSIVPEIKAKKRILITAHGNSLRALVKHLDNISDKDIVELNIPTGIPLVYELDKNLKPISKRYLGDEESIKKAAEAVANQGKAK